MTSYDSVALRAALRCLVLTAWGRPPQAQRLRCGVEPAEEPAPTPEAPTQSRRAVGEQERPLRDGPNAQPFSFTQHDGTCTRHALHPHGIKDTTRGSRGRLWQAVPSGVRLAAPVGLSVLRGMHRLGWELHHGLTNPHG